MDRRAVRELRAARRRRERRALALGVAVVLGVALLLYGTPVPRLSEELYLPLVRHTGDRTYLAFDWTMSGPFGEHWVFDHVFGPLAAAIPLLLFGWIGRLVTWGILAALLIRLGRRTGISTTGATTAVILWLVANQALIGSDWMFGTFEAKVVADCFAVGALLTAMRFRIPATMVLLGISVALHPGLGGWVAFAAVGALLADPDTRGPALRWMPVAALLAAPGVVAVLRSVTDAPAALQEFVVRSAIPQHADPFFGGADLPALQVGLRLGALVGMLVANVVWFRRAERDPGARFLIGFQLMAVVPVVVAFAARAVGAWDFLLLQPLRVGPLLIPLLFFIALVGQAERRRDHEPVHQRWSRRGSTAVLLAGALVALIVSSPTLAAPRMVARNYAAWTRNDPEADAFRWLADHTAARTRCVVSPDRQDAFMLGERAIVGNWQAIRYDALAAWRRRVGAQLEDPAILDSPPVLLPDLAASYQRIPVDRMLTVARLYGADCIVSRARYPLPVLHRSGPVGIYQVPANPAP